MDETMSRRRLIAALAGLSLLGLVIGGCYHIPLGEPVPLEPTKPAMPATAVFNFNPVEISPLPVTAGQPFTIILTVANTGAAAGTYKADLLINGSLISSQAVTIGPGMKGTASFQTTIANAGKYDVKIGPQARTIDVIAQRVPAVLKISGELVDGFDPLIGSTADPSQVHDTVEGYLVKLTAPADGFVINSIRVLGYIKSSTYDYDHNPIYGPGIWVYGNDIAASEPIRSDFTVNIYDARRNRLYSGNFNKDLFTYTPGWVVLNIPPTAVKGDFSIEVKMYNPPRLNATGWGDWDPWHRYVVHTWYYQVWVGYENAVEVQSFVSQDGSAVPDRYLTYNWLIQAAGYKP
jgi:hypothetical protein